MQGLLELVECKYQVVPGATDDYRNPHTGLGGLGVLRRQGHELRMPEDWGRGGVAWLFLVRSLDTSAKPVLRTFLQPHQSGLDIGQRYRVLPAEIRAVLKRAQTVDHDSQ